MRVILQSENHPPICLPIPLGLILNRIVVFILVKALSKKGMHLSGEQMLMLMNEIKGICKCHPGWVLLEAKNASGETVKIIV